MTPREELLSRLKEWPAQERDRLAAELLASRQAPKFQGSITIHFAGGTAKRVEVKEAREI